jgi:uncharacterized linocin/CFP29 family protein
VITGRGNAPIAPEAWTALEADTRETLKQHLVGRRVVDFDGPHGLGFAALNLGSIEPKEVAPGITGGTRAVLPLLEVRVPFELSRAVLDDRERGAPELSDDPALDAARRLAELEDRAIFHGLASAQVRGLLAASSQAKIPIGTDARGCIDAVTRALLALDEAAVDGPYAVVLGHAAYRRVAASPEYPPLRQLRELVGESVLRSRVLEGGLVVSLRGGDFQLTVGQDADIGYASHDAERVSLYLVESFTFLVSSPEAVVGLEE